MTYEELHKLIERITLRPGWQLSLGPITNRWEFTEPKVGVIAYVPCTYGNDPVEIAYAREIPKVTMMAGEIAVLRFIKTRIVNVLEEHESDEWFKLDGEPVFNPHKPSATESKYATTT